MTGWVFLQLFFLMPIGSLGSFVHWIIDFQKVNLRSALHHGVRGIITKSAKLILVMSAAVFDDSGISQSI